MGKKSYLEKFEWLPSDNEITIGRAVISGGLSNGT